MAHLGVTEWENLGYRDSGMMGRPGNLDPRAFWQADLDEAIGRLVWLVRRHPPGRHDDLQRVRRLRPPRPHPDPPRGRRRVRASRRPGLLPGPARPGARRDAARPRPTAASRRGRRRSSTSRRSRASVRNGDERGAGRRSASARSGCRPRTPRPSSSPSSRSSSAKLLVPDEAITTRVDVGPYVEAKWEAMHEHVTQISDESPFMLLGLDGWRRWWSTETFILRESRSRPSCPRPTCSPGSADRRRRSPDGSDRARAER